MTVKNIVVPYLGVALHAEGVGRNNRIFGLAFFKRRVALHAEGVGRNTVECMGDTERDSRPPCGGRG